MMLDLYRKDLQQLQALGTELLDAEGNPRADQVIVRGEEEELTQRVLGRSFAIGRVLVKVKREGRWTAELIAEYQAIMNTALRMERQVVMTRNSLR
jgi:hypothetical protein